VEATRAEERYLAAIDRLSAADPAGVTGAALARDLGLSAPSVHEMLRRLASDDFVARETSGWVLTEAGRRQATAGQERRAVAERFLRDVLAVPDELLVEEAERLGSVLSPRLEQRMRAASEDSRAS
jgi:DtxR family Mn-dependent transcriptional regulator